MCARYAKDNERIRAKTKKLLLDSALKVFARLGIHAGSIALIAKEAGVSKGLAYHYFSSKEDILVDLAVARLDEWAALIKGLESLNDPFQRLEFLVDFVLNELKQKKEWLRFYTGLYLTHDGQRAISKAMEIHRERFERLFSLERGILKDLGVAEVEAEQIYLRSILQGICLEYMLSDDYPLDVMRKRLIQSYEKRESEEKKHE
ncbi:MAG: TetR/AcrR family transcriptional regulator [Chlamydiia bacterium]|nr:TetR/AcrR family transcriptional regulator [Chlamydiia bacterium]